MKIPSLKSKKATYFLVASILILGILFASTFTFYTRNREVYNEIYAENLKKGTTDWESEDLRKAIASEYNDKGKPNQTAPGENTAEIGGDTTVVQPGSTTAISGYANHESINRGEQINFHISTSSTTYSLDVFRMGWYGGAGSRSVLSAPITGLKGVKHPMGTPRTSDGFLSADWPVAYSLQTQSDWVSGMYLAKLTTGGGSVNYIPFVLRSDDVLADIIYQIPFSNYQAYNTWGGKSLYTDSSTNGQKAVRISYDRPYIAGTGTGLFFKGDYNMIRFLESKGYSITYASSADTHARPSIFKDRKVFLSAYHDEYWSKPMRDNVTAARDSGKHLAFFDSNNVYWQVRFENGPDGTPVRTMVCYKGTTTDPLYADESTRHLTTTTWRNAVLDKPENELLGIMYESWFDSGTSFPWVVKNSGHWVYENTGLKDNDQIAGLVGYENDKIYDNGRTPSGIQILSESPIINHQGKSLIGHSSLYSAQSGAMVFSAGSNFWPRKVDANSYLDKGVDTRVQIMTQNILNRMISTTSSPTTVPTTTLVPTPTNSPIPTDSITPTPLPTATPVVTQAPTTIPTTQALTISNLQVKDLTNSGDWSIRSNLQVGNQQFGDRSYKFTQIPTTFLGSQWIRTANDSVAYTGNPLITFSINRDATVYIAHDDRVSTKPSWMSGWVDTGMEIINDNGTPRPASIYKKDFRAGTVSLGPNGRTYNNMYSIFVK